MKAIAITNNLRIPGSEPEGKQGWFFIADSGVSNTGKPFYLPEGVGKTVAAVGIAVRISRLGKSVQPKFASRYFREIAPAIYFHLPELEEKLLREGLPGDAARSFDRCLMIGEYREYSPEATVELIINGEHKTGISGAMLVKPIEECIAMVSRLNTLKMGDVVLPGMSRGIELKEEDVIEVKGTGMTGFRVKVK